jgi:FkbM family methyltransferase
MYLNNLIWSKLAIAAAPKCFVKRLLHPDLVSFGMMANLATLTRRGLFKDVDGVIDVGANIGQYAYMAHYALPHLPIYSFEPDPECFVKLKTNFKRFSIPGQCERVAISNYVGSSPFNIYSNRVNNSIHFRLDHEAAGGKIITVPCTTLDAMSPKLGHLRNPLLKLDVQGHELSVLEGASLLLKRCRFVQLEVSSRLAYKSNADAAGLFTMMRDKGFRWFDIIDTLRDSSIQNSGILETDLLFLNESA